MKKEYRILILISMLFFVFCNDVFAQGYDYWEKKDNVELMNIKREISVLLAENTKLSSEYNSLRREFYDIKAQAENVVFGIKAMEEKSLRSVGMKDKRSKGLKEMRGNLKKLKDDALISKSRISYLKGKFLDREEKMNLWNLKFKELDFKKRELEMELEMRSALHESEVLKEKEKLDRLTQALEQNLRKKQELKSHIIFQQTKGKEAAESIGRISMEIKFAEGKVKLLQKEKEYNAKMLVFLKDKRTIVVKEQELALWDDEYNKVFLKEEVKKLKQEQEEFTKSMQAALSRQTRKRELLDQVMGVDKKNQQLRRQIADYEKTIELIK